MIRLMRFPDATPRDPAVDAWLRERSGTPLGALAAHWFGVMRDCGADVRELLHDGHPTACVGDAAFAYVNIFTAHANVGFFVGPELDDPCGLLEGTGQFTRHVKLRPGHEVDSDALTHLVHTAYRTIRESAASAP